MAFLPVKVVTKIPDITIVKTARLAITYIAFVIILALIDKGNQRYSVPDNNCLEDKL